MRKRTIGLIASLLCIGALAACTTFGGNGPPEPDLSFAQEQAAKAHQTIDTERIKAVEQRDAALAAGDSKTAADAIKTISTLDEIKKRLAAAETTLAGIQNPDGTLDPAKTVAAAGALLPPPWNLILLLGGPLAVGLVQEWRVKKRKDDAISIINGISAAQMVNPAVAPALKAAEAAIKDEFTPGAAALVKEHKLPTTPQAVPVSVAA